MTASVATVATVIFAAAKLWVAVSGPIATTPDSAYYRIFDLSGRGRLPLATVIFAAAGSDRVAVIIVTAISIVAWVFLAAAMAGFARQIGAARSVAPVAFVAVLVVAVSGPIAVWDLVIYSESLFLSATALAVALLLRLRRRPTTPRFIALVAVLPAMGFIRENALPWIAVIGGWSVVILLLARRDTWRPRVIAAVVYIVVLAVLVAGSSAYYERNDTGTALTPRAQQLSGLGSVGTAEANFAGVYFTAIEPYPARNAWFKARGMPSLPPAVLAAVVSGADPDEVWAQKTLMHWAQHDSTTVLAEYAATHFGFVAQLTVHGQLQAALAPTSGWLGSNLDQSPGHPLAPAIVNRILSFAYDGAVLWLAIAAALIAGPAVLIVRYWRGQRLNAVDLLIGPSLVLLSVGSAVASLVASVIEYERHGVPSHATLLIGMLVTAVALTGQTGSRSPSDD